jgi:HD-GYP domain-containing protein (c-di-GMP phosphodiesterase class II)
MAQTLRFDESFIDALRLAAPLHKPGKLVGDEWKIMQTHTQIGSDILEKVTVSVSKLTVRLAHYHHENWDGSGYPEGLTGEYIPLEAKIMAVADVIKNFLIREKQKMMRL